MTASVEGRHVQCNSALGTVIGICKINQNFGMMILSFEVHALARLSATTTLTVIASAKQRFKEFTLVAFKATAIPRVSAAKTRIGIFEALVPVWRRGEVLTIFPVRTKAIIGGTFFSVFQNGIGLTDLLKLIFGTSIFINVWMIFASQLAISRFDFRFSSAASYPKRFVVIPKFHNLN